MLCLIGQPCLYLRFLGCAGNLSIMLVGNSSPKTPIGGVKLGKISLTIPLTAGMKDLFFVIVVTMLKQCSSDARVLFSRSVSAIGCLELDCLAHWIANPSGL